MPNTFQIATAPFRFDFDYFRNHPRSCCDTDLDFMGACMFV